MWDRDTLRIRIQELDDGVCPAGLVAALETVEAGVPQPRSLRQDLDTLAAEPGLDTLAVEQFRFMGARTDHNGRGGGKQNE